MAIKDIQEKSIYLLRYALNNNSKYIVELSSDEYSYIYDELQQQTVSALLLPIISDLKEVPKEILSQWEKDIYHQFYNYTHYCYAQNTVISHLNSHNIPFVILKGTSASCYYPIPELRAMGDIDILTKRKDIEKACSIMEEIGYIRLQSDNDFGRTIKFVKGNLEIEIHRYFTSLNDADKADYLENLILDNICPGQTKLPDEINGLVLLEHIGDHLEHGLGLRQIIDWMMYVRQCLHDKEWDTYFKFHAEKIGLEKLAVVVTKMCQIYLGLEDDITWCNNADLSVCKDLMGYIMSSGNFGIKGQQNIQKRETIEALTNNQSLLQMVKLLQKYGEVNWGAVQKYRFLKPFAWIYQIGYSIKKRLSNKTSFREVYEEYNESRARKALFDELGVKQYSKGLAIPNGDHFEVKR